MLALTKRHCVCLMLSACLCWNTCVGWIALCSSSRNGTTVPATIGAPASVSFCVQSNLKVYTYIKIEHSKHGSKWYQDDKEMNPKIQVQIGPQVSGLTRINITVQQVDNEDLTDVFSVRASTFGNTNDVVRFCFRLEYEDAIPKSKEQLEISSITHPASLTTAVKYTSLSTTDTTTTRAITTVTKPEQTTEAPSCPSQENSECPEMWYPLDDKMCLTVIASSTSSTPEQQCAVLGAQVSTETAITSMISCLMYLLKDSKAKAVALKNRYLNVMYGTYPRSPRGYHVVCLLEKQPMKDTSQAATTEETDLIFVWPLLAVLTILGLAMVGVLVYRKKAKRHASSRILTSSDGANDDSEKVMYANLKELENEDYARINQEAPKRETSVKNHEVTEFTTDLTDQDSGRMISEEGLVYVTVAHAADKDNKKTNQAKQKPKRNRQKPPKSNQDHGESVEYMTLNYDKTGQSNTGEGEGKNEEQ